MDIPVGNNGTDPHMILYYKNIKYIPRFGLCIYTVHPMVYIYIYIPWLMHTYSISHDLCVRSGAFDLSLQWRHNGCDSVSNHQPHECLLNRLFRRRSKKTSKFRVTGLCAGNSPVRGIHRWPVNFPHKWPVTRKMFPFDDVIMLINRVYPMIYAQGPLLLTWMYFNPNGKVWQCKSNFIPYIIMDVIRFILGFTLIYIIERGPRLNYPLMGEIWGFYWDSFKIMAIRS